MENASKALIIAGASAPVEEAQDVAASQTIEMFNSNFASFAGKQNAMEINELLKKVVVSNEVYIKIHMRFL